MPYNPKSSDNLKKGNPGNRGARGLIPNSLRKLCRDGWEQGIPRIIDIATGEADGVAPNESVAAWNALGKYGVGELTSVTLDDGEVVRIAVQVVHDLFGPERLAEFTQAVLTALGREVDGDDSAGTETDA